MASDALRRRIEQIEQLLLARYQQRAGGGEGGGLDSIRGDVDRALMIRFSTEVYLDGDPKDQNEREAAWAQANPAGYERLKQICGTVPANRVSNETKPRT